MIVTIDGPAGSGKSTVARRLADRLGVPYLDTGAMYRAATVAAVRAGADLDDAAALAELVGRISIRLDVAAKPVRVFLDNEEVTEQIRSAEISNKTTVLARAGGVRAKMVAQQQRIGAELGGLVTEGRDQGSVVFPNADAKFYLDARADVRSRRRMADLAAAGERVEFEDMLTQVLSRDESDRRRKDGPLVIPPDAEVVDTSDMTIDQVVDLLYARVVARAR